MPNIFRNNNPKRTCKKSYSDYKKYKSFLREDFNRRCGYTDCCDHWFGGAKTFHIDHFKPKIKYPSLVTSYSTLVYCCSYVNIQKADDEGKYLEPCDVDYNDHFERDDVGNILPKASSPQAMYMYTKLKLYLKRYQIIWMLEKVYERKIILGKLIENSSNNGVKNSLCQLYYELDKIFMEYYKYLSSEQ
jgi:hypothetical protein